MSIFIMSQVWRESPNRGVDLLVELALADFADDAGRCWPAIQTIALKSRCSDREVQRSIRQLEEQGRIVVEDQSGPRGTNVYTLHPGGDEMSGVTFV